MWHGWIAIKAEAKRGGDVGLPDAVKAVLNMLVLGQHGSGRHR